MGNWTEEDLLNKLGQNKHLKISAESNIEDLSGRKHIGSLERQAAVMTPSLLPMAEPRGTFKLVLPFPPSLNMAFPTNKQGRRFPSARYRQFKTDAAKALKTQLHFLLKGNLKVTMLLYRPKKQGDIDNYGKVVFDTLKGKCYEDDSQIVELHIFRFDDKFSPRVELEFTEIF